MISHYVAICKPNSTIWLHQILLPQQHNLAGSHKPLFALVNSEKPKRKILDLKSDTAPRMSEGPTTQESPRNKGAGDLEHTTRTKWDKHVKSKIPKAISTIYGINNRIKLTRGVCVCVRVRGMYENDRMYIIALFVWE